MDQRYVDLAAAIVRQAFYDAARDYHHTRHMDADAWLVGAARRCLPAHPCHCTVSVT